MGNTVQTEVLVSHACWNKIQNNFVSSGSYHETSFSKREKNSVQFRLIKVSDIFSPLCGPMCYRKKNFFEIDWHF